jgi:hypothetical protein
MNAIDRNSYARFAKADRRIPCVAPHGLQARECRLAFTEVGKSMMSRLAFPFFHIIRPVFLILVAQFVPCNGRNAASCGVYTRSHSRHMPGNSGSTRGSGGHMRSNVINEIRNNRGMTCDGRDMRSHNGNMRSKGRDIRSNNRNMVNESRDMIRNDRET